MCTLSWTSTDSGYDLFFNRDERIERAAESAACESLHAGVRVLAPRDGDAGGTWITVNEYGVTNALLNGYFGGIEPSAPERRSRGLLVLDHANVHSPAELLANIEPLDLSPYEPFVLCTFQASAGGSHSVDAAIGLALEWNGARLTKSILTHEQVPICSSAIDDSGARSRRTAEWTRLKDLAPMSAARLAAFHASHLDGADTHSPCMHRPDAETRSMVHVRVDALCASLTHTPGPPCRTGASATLTLNRRPASASLN